MRKFAWLAASLIAVFVLVAACAPGSAPVGQTWVLATVTPSGAVAPAAVAVAVAGVATPAPVVVVTTTPPVAGAIATPVAPSAPAFDPPVLGTLTMIASNPTGMILADVSVQTAGGWKVANGGTRGTCALIITDGSVTMKAVAGTPSVHMVNEAWGITAHANAGGTNGEGCAFVKVFVFRSGNLAEYRLVDAASGSMQEVDPSMW